MSDERIRIILADDHPSVRAGIRLFMERDPGIIAAGAGLLSFAPPCVVPLVPGYLGYLSGATVGANRTGSIDAQARAA